MFKSTEENLSLVSHFLSLAIASFAFTCGTQILFWGFVLKVLSHPPFTRSDISTISLPPPLQLLSPSDCACFSNLTQDKETESKGGASHGHCFHFYINSVNMWGWPDDFLLNLKSLLYMVLLEIWTDRCIWTFTWERTCVWEIRVETAILWNTLNWAAEEPKWLCVCAEILWCPLLVDYLEEFPSFSS